MVIKIRTHEELMKNVWPEWRLKVGSVVRKIGPFVGMDYEIGLAVEIGLVVGIGLFEGTDLVVSLIYIRMLQE